MTLKVEERVTFKLTYEVEVTGDLLKTVEGIKAGNPEIQPIDPRVHSGTLVRLEPDEQATLIIAQSDNRVITSNGTLPDGYEMVDTLPVQKTSQITGAVHTMLIPITYERLLNWVQGNALIQEAFPDLTPVQREFLMTGIVEEEWNEFITDNEEEDETDISDNN